MKLTDAETHQNAGSEMGKKKRKKRSLKLNPTIPAFRWRQDVDYFDKLPREAQKYLRKFLDEIYGRKFDSKGLGRNKGARKEIYHDTYAANNDLMHVLIRLDVDPSLVDLQIQTVPSADLPTLTPKEPEIEKVYVENGVKVTRYKPQK